MEYTEYKDEKHKRMIGFNECIESLCIRNFDQNVRIKSLVEENKRLKSEYYKDIELQNLQSKYDELKKDAYRGFPNTEEESKRIYEWKYKHEMQEHPRASYSYIFTPTALGLVGRIKCSCGAEFDFRKLEKENNTIKQ